MHFECDFFFLLQRAYKQYVLECLAEYRVKKMPYAIQPKLFPSGNKKVFNVFIKLFNLLERVHFTQIYIFSTYFCIVVVWKKTSCLVILRWWLQWFGTSRILRTQFHCGSSSWLFWLVYCFWLFSYTSYTEWVLLWYKKNHSMVLIWKINECDFVCSRLCFLHFWNGFFSSCSWASSNDLTLTALPWRKRNSNRRLPLRPKRPPKLPKPQYLAIWLQRRIVVEYVEWILKKRKKDRSSWRVTRKKDYWNSTVLH